MNVIARMRRLAIGGSLALAIASAALVPYGPRAAAETSKQQVPSDAPVDERWLKLVHGSSKALIASATGAEAVNTLHVNASTGELAGRVSNGGSVSLQVTRAGVTQPAWLVQPIDSGDGYFFQAGFGLLNAGDTILATQANSTISLTVPELTALADGASNTVFGSGPPNKAVEAHVFPASTPETTVSQSSTTNISGTFTLDFTSVLDLKGGDVGYVIHRISPTLSVSRRIATPQILIPAGRGYFQGYGAPNTTGTISITSASGMQVYGVQTASNGQFLFYPDSSVSLPQISAVSVRFGEQTISSTALPLTARYDSSTETVQGVTTPNKPILIYRYNASIGELAVSLMGRPRITTEVISDAAGRYAAPLALKQGESAAVLPTSPDGSGTYVIVNRDWFNVRLGANIFDPRFGYPFGGGLQAQISEFNTPFSLSIIGKSGVLKSTLQGETGIYGDVQLNDPTSLPAIETGDTIVVAAAATTVSFTAPLLDASYHPQTRTLRGTTFPNAVVDINLVRLGYSPYPPYPPPIPAPQPVPALTPTPVAQPPTAMPLANTKDAAAAQFIAPYPNAAFVVTATATGEFSVDLSGVANINAYELGVIGITTPQQHRVTRMVNIARTLCPALAVVEVGGSTVSFPTLCPPLSVNLSLLSATGQVKAIVVGAGQYPSARFVDAAGAQVQILPGDSLEWSSGPSAKTFVPEIAVTIDQTAGQVRGRGPANQGVMLSVNALSAFGTNASRTYNTVTDAAGLFTSSVNIAAGSNVVLLMQNNQGVTFVTRAFAPGVMIRLGEGGVFAQLNNSEALNVSISTALTSTVFKTFSETGADGLGFAFVDHAIQSGDNITVSSPTRIITLRVPALTANVDGTNKRITGRTTPNTVVAYDTYAWNTYGAPLFATSDAAGYYTMTVRSAYPDQPHSVSIRDTAGNIISRSTSRRGFEVLIGSLCVDRIYLSAQYISATLTLADGAGKVKNVSGVTVVGSNVAQACFNTPILTGDQLSLVAANGQTLAMRIPSMSARYSRDQKVITGNVGANRPLRIFLQPVDTVGAQRTGQSGANGAFGFDLTDLRFQARQDVLVEFVDADGNTIRQVFTFAPYQMRLPIAARN